MTERPTLAILGSAGTMGSALARRCVAAGYTVRGFDRVEAATPQSWQTFPTAVEAVAGADIVILAVPFAAEVPLASDLAEALGGTIVVSMSNPLTATLDDVVTPDHSSAAEMVARILPRSRVVKAFNTIGLAALQSTATAAHDTFVASDDEPAAQDVVTLIAALGFRAWYVGPLLHSRTLERMTALVIGISFRYGLQGAVGFRVAADTP